MTILNWNFGVNAQLEQSYSCAAFNWLSDNTVIYTDTDGNFSFTDDLRPFVNDDNTETQRSRTRECT